MGRSVFAFMEARLATMQFPDPRGRVVVVTGAGRPQGIGAATCRGFADQGCTIFFTTYSPYDKAMHRDGPNFGISVYRLASFF